MNDLGLKIRSFFNFNENLFLMRLLDTKNRCYQRIDYYKKIP